MQRLKTACFVALSWFVYLCEIVLHPNRARKRPVDAEQSGRISADTDEIGKECMHSANACFLAFIPFSIAHYSMPRSRRMSPKRLNKHFRHTIRSSLHGRPFFSHPAQTHGSHRKDSWKEGSVLGVMRRDASQLHFSGVPTERLLPRPSTSGTLEEPCGCCLRLTIGAYFQLSFDAASPEGRGEAVGGSFYH